MSNHTRPPIDKSQFPHFLRMLDPRAQWITIQTFTDREDKPSPDPLAKVYNVNRITRAVLDRYEEGAGIWVTINDTDGNGRKKEAVTRIRAVWQEDDAGYEGEFPLEPSVVVETSPGHFHRYWLVDGDWPADEQGCSDFSGVMACMVASYGSDPGAKDISRVLRLPGFLHRKNPNDPHMVRVVGGCRRRYTRRQILAAFPRPAKASPPPGSNGHARDGESESHAELVRQILTGEHYHPALCSLAFRLVGGDVPAGQVVEQLRGFMLARPKQEQDARWHARFAQIPELVSSAESKQRARAPGADRKGAQNAPRKLVSTRLSDVTTRRIEWVWKGRLAVGKHTTIAGEPGIGKSTMLYWTAATITKGDSWPCDEGTAPMGSVIILSAEDGAEDTIKPRVLAAGGDPEKVTVITATRDENDKVSGFTLSHDLRALEALIDELGDVKLVIIDPISSYLGDVDGHSNTDIRGVVEPLHEMADRKKVAVLTNTHFAKSGAANKSRASHRVIGSTAFIALPRVALSVVQDSEDEERRLVLHLKNNIAPAAKGLAFKLVQKLACYIDEPPAPLYASCVEWEAEYVSTTADEAIAEHEDKLRSGAKKERAAPARDAAEAFIRELFKGRESDTLASKEMAEAAREVGITPKALREARERLCETVTERGEDGVVRGWLVRLRKGVQP